MDRLPAGVEKTERRLFPRRSFHKLLMVLVLCTIVRIVFANYITLAGDEAYHWEWSRHLAWGYYDHPPLTALCIRLSTLLLGNTEIGVRAPAMLLLALTSLVVYRTTWNLTSNERAALWAGLLVQCIPILSAYGFYMSTDPVSIFCWALSLWLFQGTVLSEKPAALGWIATGLAAGAGLMSKFLNAFFAPSALVYLALSRRGRRSFLSPWAWLGLLCAVAVFLPFVYWNATHDWVTFRFHLSFRHPKPAGWTTPIKYLLGQALVVSPLLFLGFVSACGRCWVEGIRRRDDVCLFLAAMSSTMFLIFFLLSFRVPVAAVWLAPGYVGLCVLLPYAVFREQPLLSLKFLTTSGPVGLAFVLVLHAGMLVWCLWPPLLRNLYPGTIKDNELYWIWGYEEVGRAAVELARKHDAILMTPSYGLSSTLAFYAPGQPETHLFAAGGIYGLNYLIWDDGFLPYKGRNAILVTDTPIKGAVKEKLNAAFVRVDPPVKLAVMNGSEVARTFYLVPCFDLVQPSAAAGVWPHLRK